MSQQLLAQSVPIGVNQVDSKNRRQGSWVIWFDREFRPVAKQEDVHYYRLISYRDDIPIGEFSDHFRNGAVQCKGKLVQDRPDDIYNGLITWYREDGSKEQEAVFDHGELKGDIRVFSSDGKPITASFQDLNALGMQASETGNFDAACRYYEDALTVIGIEYAPDHFINAPVLDNLARSQTELGRYQKAEENFLKAISIHSEQVGESDEVYAMLLNDMGNFYKVMSSYKKAENYLLQALTLREKVLGAKHPDYAITLNDLGLLYSSMGLNSKAISYLERACSAIPNVKGRESSGYATRLSNLGLAYQDAGDYIRAETLLSQAMEIKKRLVGVNHIEYAACLNNLATLYSTSGNSEKAAQLLQEALAVYVDRGKTNPGYSSVLNNLAILYKQKEEYKKAENLYLECIKNRKETLGELHPSYINSLNNLAELYKATGEYQKAEPLYLQVRQSWGNTLGKEHYLYATALYNLGTLYSEMHECKRAEENLREAMKIREKALGKNHPDYNASLNSVAVLYDNENLDKQAEPYYKESIERKLNEIQNYFPSLSEAEKTKYYNTNRIYFQNFEEFSVSQLQENPALAGDLFSLRLTSKAMLFHAVKKMRAAILSSKDSQLIELFNQWQDRRDYLANVYRMSQDERQQNEINASLLETELNTIEKELSKRSELFVKTHDRKRYTWKDVQNNLAPGEAAIEIIQTQRRSKEVKKVYVMLIVKGGTNSSPEFVVLENGDELDSKYIKYYRNAIIQKMNDAISYEQFWKPVAKMLLGIKRLYISSDGVYNQINLGTLFNPQSNHFLMDEMEIRNITSTKDLITTSGLGSKQIMEAALFGYPDYNQADASPQVNNNPALSGNQNLVPEIRKDSGQRFFDGSIITELPGTKREIESIASILVEKKVNVKSHLYADASEDILKKLEMPQLLHVATHGYFLQDAEKGRSNERGYAGFTNEVVTENPLLRSGLLLSGARNAFVNGYTSDADNDGLLTAYEAMNLNLDMTELVVLSACETGLGVTVNGEGVYGLQRAFSVAGSRYTLMSLWKVDDTATQEFMSSFYRAWIDFTDIHKALRKAQQEVRTRYSEPYYWGAFVLSGL